MDDRKELEAFFHFFATFDLSRPVSAPSDLSDGAALSDILAIVYVCVTMSYTSPEFIYGPVIRGISRRLDLQLSPLITGS